LLLVSVQRWFCSEVDSSVLPTLLSNVMKVSVKHMYISHYWRNYQHWTYTNYTCF